MTQEEKAKAYDAYAWLEKQGQTFTKKDIDDAYLKGVCDAKSELEKQGEQKPILNVPTREVILSIWDLGNEWKELTNGCISTKYGTQLDYIQKHWRESEYYLREKQGEKKSSLPKWRYKRDNTPLLRDSLVLNKYGCVLKALSGAIISNAWILDYAELAELPREEPEKQDEQNHCMIQWKGDNLKEVIDFTGKDKNFEKWFKSFEEYEKYVQEHDGIFKLFNADGSHYEVPVGAWIVKTPDGYNVASKAVFKQKSVDTPKFKVEQTSTWSEEDENIGKELMDFCIKCSQGHTIVNSQDDFRRWTTWLKSLRPKQQ